MSTLFDPQKVFIGITPTSWWNDDFLDIDAGITFGQCVSEMALAGYQGCSVGHKYPKDPLVLRQELDQRGLRVSEPWTSTFFSRKEMYDKTIADFCQSMNFIKQMGGKDVVVAELGFSVHQRPVALMANRPHFDDASWDLVTEGLNELGRIANEEGMNLCYHHHLGTGIMTRPDVDRLMESTDPDKVHLLLDTGHLYVAGGDPLKLAQDYGHRIKHVHLKNIRQRQMDSFVNDNLSFKEGVLEGFFTVPGDPEGCIDFAPILEALAKACYEGWLIVEAEQDPNKANPLHYARMGRDYLRKVIGY